MRKVAKLNKKDLKNLYINTYEKTNIKPSLIEKDFWVCYALDYIFNISEYKDAFIFKGGTSLSKAFHTINRFSEDIDLILDWTILNHSKEELWKERSHTLQDKLNTKLNEEAGIFLKDKFLPNFNKYLHNELGEDASVSVNTIDPQVLIFHYPRILNDDYYILKDVLLEVGPIAEWLPHHKQVIKTYVAEKYDKFFEMPEIMVPTIDAERTFWEKITILHKIANRNTSKLFPQRYARHYYDVYMLSKTSIKDKAFKNKELLEKDILFKEKFYYSKGASYDTCKIGSVKLMPKNEDINSIAKDYDMMKEMIYKDIPSFEEMFNALIVLENEINNL